MSRSTSAGQGMCEGQVECVGHWWSVWDLCSRASGSTSVGQGVCMGQDSVEGCVALRVVGLVSCSRLVLLKEPHRRSTAPSKA